jgi:hypothetical protein
MVKAAQAQRLAVEKRGVQNDEYVFEELLRLCQFRAAYTRNYHH